MELFESLRKTLLAGIGAQDKVKELIEDFIKRGELSESQGAKFVKEWSAKAEKGTSDMNKMFSDIVKATLEKMNIPTMEEIDKLNKNLKNLTARVKKLEERLEENPQGTA